MWDSYKIRESEEERRWFELLPLLGENKKVVVGVSSLLQASGHHRQEVELEAELEEDQKGKDKSRKGMIGVGREGDGQG